MRFFSSLLLALQVIPILIWGWVRLFFRILVQGFQFISNKKIPFIILFFTTLAQLFFSVRPWIVYNVDFVDNPETIYVSVKSNLYIVIRSFINFLLINFYLRAITVKVFFVLQVIALSVYFLGLAFPDVFFVDFQNPSDYQFHLAAILFGAFAGFNLFMIFWNRKLPESTETQT